LWSDEVTVKDGIPVTIVSRTLFDLAAVLSSGQLERAVNEAEIRRLWDRLSLQDLLVRHPRRPGAAKIRTVLAGIERPQANVPLLVEGRWIEVDCVWRRQCLIVELDGRETHGTAHAFENDRARDRGAHHRRMARHADHVAPAPRRAGGHRPRPAGISRRLNTLLRHATQPLRT